MKLMFNPADGGIYNMEEGLIDGLLKDGWVDGAPIHAAMLDAKRKAAAKVDVMVLAKPVETVTMPSQSEVRRSPGRPRKEVPSVLNDGEV